VEGKIKVSSFLGDEIFVLQEISNYLHISTSLHSYAQKLPAHHPAKYGEQIGVISFILSVVFIFVISFLTVGYKTVSRAKMNPVKTLRDE
jgi:heme/copper-type cytochrome/quinol oxidase subunit 3